MVELRIVDTIPEQLTHKEFEEQFANKELIRTPDRTIEVIDISPEILKDPVPVFIAPGWSESDKVFKESLRVVYEAGRRVISLNHPRQVSQTKDVYYPETELTKAESILAVLEEKELEKVDVITHSEGSIYATIAACLRPSKFRSMVIMNPAGMMGHDNFLGLLSRNLRMNLGNIERMGKEPQTRQALIVYLQEGVLYFLKNPKRALGEARDISGADIHAWLKNLKALGIGISVIAGVDDPLFPMDSVQQATKASEITGFYSVKGDHNEAHLQPDKYTTLAIRALDSLNKVK
ncbi:MAG: Uncharacterized protein G01um10145_912 [Microgenomates group bacterium Gr01-1014_5]|nr:MAG: Uncharacterized protein G01um10145_912 [Microgenomates group bacterium Gr01-1014_5]